MLITNPASQHDSHSTAATVSTTSTRETPIHPLQPPVKTVSEVTLQALNQLRRSSFCNNMWTMLCCSRLKDRTKQTPPSPTHAPAVTSSSNKEDNQDIIFDPSELVTQTSVHKQYPEDFDSSINHKIAPSCSSAFVNGNDPLTSPDTQERTASELSVNDSSENAFSSPTPSRRNSMDSSSASSSRSSSFLQPSSANSSFSSSESSPVLSPQLLLTQIHTTTLSSIRELSVEEQWLPGIAAEQQQKPASLPTQARVSLPSPAKPPKIRPIDNIKDQESANPYYVLPSASSGLTESKANASNAPKTYHFIRYILADPTISPKVENSPNTVDEDDNTIRISTKLDPVYRNNLAQLGIATYNDRIAVRANSRRLDTSRYKVHPRHTLPNLQRGYK